MEELIKSVEEWSKNKGLDKLNPIIQYLKVSEKFSVIASGLDRDDIRSIEHGIGFTILNLIILSQQLGLTLDQCLQTAYDEIKGSTGKMVNGVFVKSEYLQNNIDIYEIGKELLVKWSNQWLNCKIVEGYRYKDGIVTVELDSGYRIWFGEKTAKNILIEK